MPEVLWALLVWTLIAIPLGLIIGRAVATADSQADDDEGPDGHCDTCCARCDAQGCTADRSHVAALDVDDDRPA